MTMTLPRFTLVVNDPAEWALRATFGAAQRCTPEDWSTRYSGHTALVEGGDDIGIVVAVYAAHAQAVAARAQEPTVSAAVLALGTYLHKRLTAPEKGAVGFLAGLLPGPVDEDVHAFFGRHHPSVPEVSSDVRRSYLCWI